MSDATRRTDRPRRPNEAKTRVLIQVGAAFTVIGIVLAAASSPDLARWFTLGGLVALVVGLHRFGRLGADAPLGMD